MKRSLVFITVLSCAAIAAACSSSPGLDEATATTTTSSSHTTSSSTHSGGAGGQGGGGGQGGALQISCADVATGKFAVKIQLEGVKPDGEDYIAADGFQYGDTPGTWPKKYIGSDSAAMAATIDFGAVGPTWFVELSMGLTSNSDPNKAGYAVDWWFGYCGHPVCEGLAAVVVGCYGHEAVNPTMDGTIAKFTIE